MTGLCLYQISANLMKIISGELDMKKPRKTADFSPDDAERSELYWDGFLPDEEFAHHTYRAGRSASKKRKNARGTQRRTPEEMEMDDV